MKKILSILVESKIVKSSFLVIALSMFVNIINYFYHLIFGRLLGPSDYGVLASLYSILYIVSIVPQSASYAIVKFVSSAKSENEQRLVYSEINTFTNKLSLFLVAVLLLLSLPISKFMRIENVWSVVLVSPILYLTIATMVNQATFQGRKKYVDLMMPNIISAIAKLGFGIALVYMGLKVFGVMAAVVIAALISYYYSQQRLKKFIKGRLEGNFSFSDFFAYSIPILVQSIAFMSIFTVDIILVKHFFNSHDAGIYASLSMLGKIIFFAISPIISVLFPEISSRKARGVGYRRIIFGALSVASLFCLGVTAVYFLFPATIVGLLYGKLFLQAEGNLFAMAIFMSLYSLSFILSNFLFSLNITKTSYVVISASILQIIGITMFHESLLSVIVVSLTTCFVMLISLLALLIYNLKNESK